MIWNYRGYGRTKGSPNPNNLKQDGDDLLDHMKIKMQLKGPFGIYGRSLGGIVASHLADKVQMTICDRTFSSVDDIASWKFYSPITTKVLKLATCGWKVNNDLNFLSKGLNTCYKVICADPKDEVIDLQS